MFQSVVLKFQLFNGFDYFSNFNHNKMCVRVCTCVCVCVYGIYKVMNKKCLILEV